MEGSAPWAHDNQVYEEAGVAWNGEGCGGNESPAIVFPFPFPWRISNARFCAACIAAVGGACFFLGFAASATILSIYFAVSNTLVHKKIRGRREKEHAPFELAPFLVRLIRDGALEDRAEEQQPPRTVVELLVAHARFLQDMVYNLHAVGTL